MSERLHALHEVVGHAEVEALRAGHFQRQISLALPVNFLRPRELEFAIVAYVIADHFLKNVVDRRRQQVHSEPAEEDVVFQTIDAELLSGRRDIWFLDDERDVDQPWVFRAALPRDGAKAFQI